METIYYSPSLRRAYSESMHGALMVLVPVQDWEAPAHPTIEIDGELVPDPDWIAPARPMVEVDNPDCRIPEDAVEVDGVVWQALLVEQSTGKLIVPDPDSNPPGFPIAIDPPPEEPTVPALVTMRQARLALLNAGLLEDVNTAIDNAGPAEQIEWEYAQSVERDSALVAAMSAALGLSEEQIDDLFTQAATL